MDNFQNICGQDLAIKILKSAISKEHISHAYLFSGPEGVGRKKTAKIFINAILEKNQDKENGFDATCIHDINLRLLSKLIKQHGNSHN